MLDEEKSVIVYVDEITGVKHEATPDGHIHIFMLPNTSRASVESWFTYTLKFIESWDSAQPQLIMLLGTSRDFTMTPLVHARRDDITALSKQRGIFGRLALVIPETVNGHVIQTLVRFAPQSVMKMRIFFSYEDGLKWLREGGAAVRRVDMTGSTNAL